MQQREWLDNARCIQLHPLHLGFSDLVRGRGQARAGDARDRLQPCPAPARAPSGPLPPPQDLERRYVSNRNHQLSALYDEGALWVHLAMNLVAFWITTAADPDCWRLAVVVSMAMALQKVTFRFLGKQTYRV
jgi:hypothetical protein